MRVLVAEDDANVQSMVQMVLELEGFDVRTADDGRAALDLALEDPPDVIILDVMMPYMSGFEVAEQLAQDERFDDVPVIFCTAKSEPEDTWRGWQLGASSYLAKPFDTEQLAAEVLRVYHAARQD